MAGCRDCTTCTQNGAARTIMNLGAGLLHFSTIGMSYLVKRAAGRHCPQCPHLLSSHRQRPDQPGWQLPTTQRPQFGPPPGQYPPPGYQQPYPPQQGWQQPAPPQQYPPQPGPSWGQPPQH